MVTLCAALGGCGGDDDKDEPNYRLPEFADNSDFRIGSLGGSRELYINNCTSTTMVTSAESWISAQLSDLNGLCTIKISENKTTSSREGVVQLICDRMVVDRMVVIQEGASSGPGNGGGSDNGDDSGQFGAPTGLTLSKNGYSVTLTWNKVPQATGYLIYQSNPIAFSSGYFVATGSSTTTSYKMDCKIAGNWAFKVMAQKGSEYSDYSNTVTTTISDSDINGGGGGGGTSSKPSTPTGLRASVNGNKVTVSWNASTGASFYQLYYIGPAPHDFETFDNIYSTSTTMNCNVAGKWTIWVVAVGSDYTLSNASSKVTFTVSNSGGGGGGGSSITQLDAPTGLEVTSRSSDSFVQLRCNAVTLGYDYALYRSTSPNSGYSKITASVAKGNTDIYFTDQNPLKGTSYYKVKVSALPSLGIKDSPYSSYVKVVR